MDATGRTFEELCSGFAAAAMLRQTSKSAVAVGHYQGRPAVMKLALTSEPKWLGRMEAEQSFYRAAKNPPVQIAELLAAGTQPHFLVLSALDGLLLSTDRLMTDVDPAHLANLAEAAATLRSWQGPYENSRNAQIGIAERLDRYCQAGYLTEENLQCASQLLAATSGHECFAHGDLVGSNVIRTCTGELAFIDWEHAGTKPPGYDLAVIWAMCELSRSGKAVLLAHLVQRDEITLSGFLANLFATYARETKNYLEAGLPVTRRIVASMNASLARLQEVADRGSPYRDSLRDLLC